MTENIRRAVRPGTKQSWRGRWYSVWIEIHWNGKRLSISGVEGPNGFGNCIGSCGQCRDALDGLKPAEGWTAEMIARLAEIWDRWHLNDMKAGCEHQRAEGWGKTELDDGRWSGHVYPREHPDGVLMKPCPMCGYEYGSAWLHEDVPADVIEFLRGLPDADRDYPWTLMHN